MANATRDAGKLIESIEYYRRAVLANPYFPESIVGLANALESVCDWQGRGGLTMELYLDVTGAIIARSDDRVDSRAPGFLDKLIEICDSQIINGYHSSTGIIASDRSLEQWMETIEACLGRLSQTRRTRWEVFLGRFYAPFDRAENRVYEAGSVVRLIEMLSRVLQRRWYVDMYGSATYSPKGKSRELDISKYYRPKLPTAMVAPLAPSILPFHTVCTSCHVWDQTVETDFDVFISLLCRYPRAEFASSLIAMLFAHRILRSVRTGFLPMFISLRPLQLKVN